MKKYTILVSLLLVVFISGCFTNNLVDVRKKQEVNNLKKQTDLLEDEILTVEEQRQRQVAQLKRSLQQLQSKLKQESGEENMYMENMEGAVKLVILNKILFTPGSATINKKGKGVLEKVGQIIKKSNREIQIFGHTDNQPIRKTKYLYKSNWELSVARALKVLHIFEDQGVGSKKMVAIGYGEHKPITSNNTSKGRKSNRRVEVVIKEGV